MSGTSILVVDDAPISRKMMRLLLTHDGYEVRTAERAEDALQMLSDYRPALILADVQLPGMNGLDMTRKVKADPRTSSIMVVALTACAMKEDREKALSAGCDDYISKPIDTNTLSSKVRELMSRPPVARISSTPPPDEPVPTLSESEIEGLRERFLTDGIERSRQMLERLDTGFDSPAAARQLHEWTGSAALLGHPEISSFSRKAEELLSEQPLDVPRLREVLSDLYFSFSDPRESKAPVLPDALVTETTGKRVALIGFSTDQADAMCALLGRVKARPRLFDAADDPASDAIGDCDLWLVHVRPETLESPWLRANGRVPAQSKIIYTGDQATLISLPPHVRSRGVDFLLDRAEPTEVLMRLAFAISRNPDPAAKPDPRPAMITPTSTRMAVNRPKVVLADDDVIVRSLVKATLENHGMACSSCSNGLDALQLIRTEQPQVAVLDVNMPGMDGYEVLAAVRAEKLPTQVILLTALQQEKDALRAFTLGADDYLSKPFSPFELTARLRRLMR